MTKAIIAVIFLTISPSLSQADNFALNVGAIEVVDVPSGNHFGLYANTALSWIDQEEGGVALIPALGIEWSLESARWGFVGSLTTDFPVANNFGFDFTTTFIHDQSGGDWDNALYFLGVGPGLSVSVGKWVVSPNICMFHALNAPDWALVPGINLARIL